MLWVLAYLEQWWPFNLFNLDNTIVILELLLAVLQYLDFHIFFDLVNVSRRKFQIVALAFCSIVPIQSFVIVIYKIVLSFLINPGSFSRLKNLFLIENENIAVLKLAIVLSSLADRKGCLCLVLVLQNVLLVLNIGQDLFGSWAVRSWQVRPKCLGY